ncbi:hypothetical protein SAMN05216196_101881 [Lutimaribacter pacificus]|uniref:CTP synthetase n=1 Tax=Lutimaribacter pacificus TaxID=391948 RepID=A0A1H0CBZ9_9RHOB|nr:CTP synthetase [Lutimaribacter pacificus]SDN55301.1 hypothetical protein SAMN05216196_101881 [Lutimaribacter pacificus]SHJ46403.1 hypothetical protein SAMN05444142_101336 [Lutimaribacter pacificus]
MMRLASILYSLISTTLAGSFIVVSLVAGFTTLQPILVAAVAGFLLALPVSWAVAYRLYGNA